MPFDLGHAAAYAPEDFRVSDCNRAAVGWIERWPDWGAPLLVVHGPEGSGKTHLAHLWQARSGATLLNAPGAIEDLGAADPPAFLIDDAPENFIGDAESEEVLFHLYNHAAANGRTILVTADAPPASWNVVLPDLKSRLLAAPAAALQPPDDTLMAVVLTKLFSDRQVAVSPEVVAYLLPRMERSFAAARDLAAKIDRAALAAKRPVTVPLAREVLDSAS